MINRFLFSSYRYPLIFLFTAFLAWPSSGLLAQEQDVDATAEDEGVLEEVVVTGFRRSLQQAMNVSRESTGSVSAIVAEDISDFPDLNVAEALQRLPGMAIRREAGEGRNITVRGLGPTFNLTRVNGMEGLGTSGGTDSSGGANRARQFDFNIFASEMFNTIVVRKTAEAWFDEGAIGAVIDLRTARPFDFDGMTAVASAQMLYNDLSEEWNPRFSGMLSNTWDTFGVMLAVAYTERDILEEGGSTVRWQTNDFVACSVCSESEFAQVNDAYHPRIPRYGRLIHNQERTGVNFALQWQPSERTDIVFEGLIGKLDATRDEQFLEALIRNNEDEMDVVYYEIDSDNNMNAGTFNNAFIRIENRHDDLKTEFNQYTLQGEHWFNDNWKLSGLIGSSESDFDNPLQTTIIFDNVVDGYSYRYAGEGGTPYFDYGFDVTDPTEYLYTEFRDRPNDVLNEFDSAKLDLTWEANETWSFQAGVAWKSYGFEVNEARRDDQVADILGDSVPVTDAIAILLKGFGSGLGMPSDNDRSWVIPDIGPAAALVDLYNLPANARTRDIRSVDEDDTAYYLQANWDYALNNDMVFRGNAGLRYYETDMRSTGVLSGDSVTAKNSYSDTLPSLNLVFEPNEDMLLRAAYAQVISRPALGSLTPGGSISTFGDPTLSFGNPRLDPFQADAIDLAFEWYFADSAMFSIAAFWKDIDSFTARITEDNIPFDETGLPCDLLDASPIEGECSTLFTVTRNVNGNGGDLDGWEIAFQTPFSFDEDSFMHRFGLVANYTSVDSKVDYAAPGSASPNYGPLVGLSEESWNFTVYYEDETFSARLAANYRSDFLIRFPDRGVMEATYLDFASSWNVNEAWQLTFEIVNITDEFFDQRHIAGSPEVARPYVYHHTGRNFFIGARWKY